MADENIPAWKQAILRAKAEKANLAANSAKQSEAVSLSEPPMTTPTLAEELFVTPPFSVTHSSPHI